MAASTEILIGNADGQHLLIRPLSRSQPGLFDEGDGDWIECELSIASGGFRGSFRANLRSEEFTAFLEQTRELVEALQGSASLTTMEGQIALYLTGNGKGAIRVHGEAIDEAGGLNRLQFEFEIDQTSLVPICESLEHLLAAFPVKQKDDS